MSCMDVRVGLWRKLSAEKLMLLNCGIGEDSWESLGLQGNPSSPFWRFKNDLTFSLRGKKKKKRRLLLGRKVMTNPDSMLKSRDVTLSTKVCLDKAMVFSSSHVWMWELDYKKKLSTEELMLLNCGVGEDSWESLGLQGDPASPS